MAKFSDNSVIDAALNKIATATTMTVCSSQPANYAGIASVALAEATPSFTGPADGDTSGRKITVDEETGVTVDTTGTATHVALDDGETLLYVTTCTNQALTTGNTMTIGSWAVEIADHE